MIVNTLLYHLLLDHSGLIVVTGVAIVSGIVAFRQCQYFSGLIAQRTSQEIRLAARCKS